MAKRKNHIPKSAKQLIKACSPKIYYFKSRSVNNVNLIKPLGMSTWPRAYIYQDYSVNIAPEKR
jgi:hypothetical protein